MDTKTFSFLLWRCVSALKALTTADHNVFVKRIADDVNTDVELLHDF
ncbi:MAG: hypothetical protein QXU24_05785 [Ignisphaera sp.]